MASAKKELTKGDELAETGEGTALPSEPVTQPEIPSRSAKRAGGKSKFTVTDLGAVKFEGKFYGLGSVLELTEEQAEHLGAFVAPVVSADDK